MMRKKSDKGAVFANYYQKLQLSYGEKEKKSVILQGKMKTRYIHIGYR